MTSDGSTTNETAPRRTVITSDGARISYTDEDAGSPVVLCTACSATAGTGRSNEGCSSRRGSVCLRWTYDFMAGQIAPASGREFLEWARTSLSSSLRNDSTRSR